MAIAIAAGMTAPIAQAEWYAFGSFEPDTAYDLDWMHADPAAAGESKVYFTALTTTAFSTITKAVNPNVGALRTQIEPLGVEFHHVYLGVWKDCNGDGYVGAAEGGLREYPASLLASTDICPPSNGSPNVWTAGAHNYNGWVSEFVPFVDQSTQNIDARVYRDDDIEVWGDYHRPDEKPFHRSCTLRPFARGTLQDTGGFLNYVDCRQPILEASNRAMAAIGDPAGLRFADEDDAHSGTLGGFDIGGDESSENAAVYTADCSSGTRLGDVYNASLPAEVASRAPFHDTVIPDADPRLADDPTDVTLAGQVNATSEENPATDDCDYSNDFGHDLYEPVAGVAFETDFNGVTPENKTQADWAFGLFPVIRGANPWLATGSVLRWNGFAGAPQDPTGIGGTHFTSPSTYASKTGPRTVRLDLDNGGVEIAPAYWLTFYATLGQATLDRGFDIKAASAGTYGSWHCGSNTSGIHNGWNCDVDTWNRNADGTPMAGREDLPVPGWKYHLRDVDCYDGRIGDTGVAVEPAFYGEEACIAP